MVRKSRCSWTTLIRTRTGEYVLMSFQRTLKEGKTRQGKTMQMSSDSAILPNSFLIAASPVGNQELVVSEARCELSSKGLGGARRRPVEANLKIRYLCLVSAANSLGSRYLMMLLCVSSSKRNSLPMQGT
mmetsp:Transcript_41943/g.65438  ORF Transcript_41943/g.65438 Transcript_41943/m.65438 type:complete len:130 (-) Transcript_41943:193-582(-)